MGIESNKLAELANRAVDYREYMAFSLGVEEYAVEILRVQEIRGWEPVTRIPNVPAYVKGVLNLRGTIIPVIDLRLRLGMPFRAYEKETVVIVLRVVDGQGEKSIGVVVDAVSGVLSVDAQTIQIAPDFGARLSTEFFDGLIAADEKMVMLLDVDRLFCFSDGSKETGPSVRWANPDSK